MDLNRGVIQLLRFGTLFLTKLALLLNKIGTFKTLTSKLEVFNSHISLCKYASFLQNFKNMIVNNYVTIVYFNSKYT